MWAIVGGNDAGWDNEHGIAHRQTDDPTLDCRTKTVSTFSLFSGERSMLARIRNTQFEKANHSGTSHEHNSQPSAICFDGKFE